MPTAVETQPTTPARGRANTDKRRGRSRSPSAYLKKKGKSLKGFFKSSKTLTTSTVKKIEAPPKAPSTTVPTTPTKSAEAPPAEITTSPPREDESVYDVEMETDMPSEGLKTSSSDAESKPVEETAEGSKDTDKKDETPATPVKEQPAGLNTSDAKETQSVENTVQVILLLMEPKSRRFELLQLEFDSAKAIVQDLLSQIPSSATEESVRDQKYSGICTITGEEMTCTERLKDFVEGSEGINSVVLAMPDGMTPQEVAKLAGPILADTKVAVMVNPSGAAAPEPKAEGTPAKATEAPPKTAASPEKPKSSKKTEEKPKTKEAKKAPKESKKVETPKPASSVKGPIDQVPGHRQILFYVLLLLPIIFKYHKNMTAPLAPGDKLKAGERRSRCGLIPFGCKAMSLTFDKEGVLTLNEGKEVKWQMRGGSCSDEEVECSAVIDEEGHVMIAGARAKFDSGVEEGVSPWPFTVGVPIPALEKTKKKLFGKKQ